MTSALRLTDAALAAVPLAPDAETAREMARRELQKRVYQEQEPGLLERFSRWFQEVWTDAQNSTSDVLPGGWGLVALLLAALAVVILVVVLRTGGLSRTGRSSGALFGGAVLSAAEHRDRAEQFAAQQQWAEAVRERMRALARALEERGLIDGRPGRTADEIARDAGAVLPELQAQLQTAARRFDDIWYGSRPATSEAYDAVRAADDAAARARPVAVPVS